jgi:hypothetical protein
MVSIKLKSTNILSLTPFIRLCTLSVVLMNYFIGLVDPIRITPQIGKLGLGKQEDDEYYTQNIKRKELQTEIVETAEMEKNRLVEYINVRLGH